MRASCKYWTRSAHISTPGLDMSGRWRSAISIPCSSSWRWEVRVRVRRLEPPSPSLRHSAATTPGNEASHQMFFEFTRGSSFRAVDEPRLARDLEERFETALRNTAMLWRQAVDRRLRRLG